MIYIRTKGNNESNLVYFPINEELGIIKKYELQSKTIVVDSNQDKVVNPDYGYYGLSSVRIISDFPNIEESKTTQATSNGKYTVIPSDGFDALKQAEIDIAIPEKKIEDNKTQSITSNGQTIITPTAGNDGMAKVTIDVNVSQTGQTINNQDKSVEITANTTTKITADEGYTGLGEVTVETNIPLPKYKSQTKTVDITENKSYTVSPDAGYDGLSKVDITVNVPSIPTQEKSESITSNKTIEILPDEGYNLSKVIVDVNVPQTGQTINNQDKTVSYSSNGSYRVTYDDEYTGLGEVRVNINVPQSGITGKADITLPYVSLKDYSGTTVPDEVYNWENLIDGDKKLFNSSIESFSENLSSLTTGGDTLFYGCTSLKDVVILGQLNCDGLDFTSCPLTVDSMLSILNALKDLTGEPTKNIILGSEKEGSLTPEQIAIATNKNWNVKFCNPFILPSNYTFSTSDYIVEINDCLYDFSNNNNVTISNMPYLEKVDITAINEYSLINNFKVNSNPILKSITIRFEKINYLVSAFENNQQLENIAIKGTENVTDTIFCFKNCTSLNNIELFDTSNVSKFSDMFYGCSSLVEIPQLDTSKGTDFNRMFYGCSSLVEIPQLDTSKGTDFNSTFRYCSELVTVPELNVSYSTNLSLMFSNCPKLQNMGGLVGLKVGGIGLSTSPLLTKESLMNVINKMADLTGQSSQTLTLGSTNLAKLTDDEKAIATGKNWILA